MIVKDADAIKRLNSPMNLINRLRGETKKNNAMSLFGIGKQKEVLFDGISVNASDKTGVEHTVKNTSISFNPFQTKDDNGSLVPTIQSPQVPSITPEQQPERLDNILENHESQIKLGLAHDKALELLNRSVEMLNTKLDDIKADKLPAVVSAASKTVESIRRERNENNKNNKDREVHYHFYTPQQRKISDYEVIDVA